MSLQWMLTYFVKTKQENLLIILMQAKLLNPNQ